MISALLLVIMAMNGTAMGNVCLHFGTTHRPCPKIAVWGKAT